MPDIRERPIIFSGAMVRSILEGRKTQTRRIVAENPNEVRWNQVVVAGRYGWEDEHGRLLRNRYGKEGDRLWVREAWRETGVLADPIAYRADEDTLMLAGESGQTLTVQYKWRPSIHMPRSASRITLEIADVRIEKLQDITDEDAVAEGFGPSGWSPTFNDPDNVNCLPTYTPRDNFAVYWGSLNAKRGYSWDSNPWVWIIEFKRLENNA